MNTDREQWVLRQRYLIQCASILYPQGALIKYDGNAVDPSGDEELLVVRGESIDSSYKPMLTNVVEKTEAEIYTEFDVWRDTQAGKFNE